MKKNILLISLTCLFVLLLTATAYVSFSGNIETQELTIKSITPIYDISSGVKVSNEGITFNDKNQVVDYKVLIENTQNYDVKINNVSLTTPTEEFLSFEVEDIQENDVVEANSTKEITISFETMGIEGWGRNFSDELTANISFEKVAKQEEVIPPKEEEQPKEETPEEEDKTEQEEPTNKPSEGGESSKPIPKPEAPVKDNKELIKNVEKIEDVVVTTNTIELPKEIKVSVGEKVAIWIYSDPIFLGYFDVVVENGIKKIEGLEEALSKADVKAGEHNIVLVSNEETIGYIPVSINENKELITEDNKRDEAIENPYTSDNGLLITLITATSITGLAIVIVSKNKVTKYMVFAIVLGSTLIPTNAEDSIELPITFNVNFESQNVMKPSGCEYNSTDKTLEACGSYWEYRKKIINYYIQNEITEIKDVIREFDVTQSDNGRVKAYLVKNKDDSNYYDLYLQADGMIYPNTNASWYFGEMDNLDIIDNLAGFDTSNVTNMEGMFFLAGYNSTTFTMDISSFNTSKVTTMKRLFDKAGYKSSKLELDVSNFDTSKVTDMRGMFQSVAYLNNTKFTLDVSNFNTSNVTNMRAMFNKTGYSSSEYELDVSGFDTSKVLDMGMMFQGTGYSNPNFTLDVSNFDTSKVTDMSYMFNQTGFTSKKITLDVSNFDTSKVTNMAYTFNQTGFENPNFTLNLGKKFNTSNVTSMELMFYKTGYLNESFTLDISNFDTSKVTNMRAMFAGTGYKSKKLNLLISITNPNVTSYSDMFNIAATEIGSIIKLNYTAETEELVKKMIATKSANSNVVLGNLVVDVDNLSTGDEIHISGEKFNVISQTDDTVTMLAQYNLDENYRQSTTENKVTFSENTGWEHTPGPKEIDIQIWSSGPKTYVNEYVEYLKSRTGDTTIKGNLITLKDLESLGCTIHPEYAWVEGGWTCTNSKFNNWLINNQTSWTSSAHLESSYSLWLINSNGILLKHYYYSTNGIRPVVTISKDALKGLNS